MSSSGAKLIYIVVLSLGLALPAVGCGDSGPSRLDAFAAYTYSEEGYLDFDPSKLPGVPEMGKELDCSQLKYPVYVTGGDRYNLDEDHDEVGCDEYLPTDEEISDYFNDSPPSAYPSG